MNVRYRFFGAALLFGATLIFGPDAAADATAVGRQAKAHRDALRAAMHAAGFRVNPAEWWHFSRLWGWRWPIARTPARR